VALGWIAVTVAAVSAAWKLTPWRRVNVDPSNLEE
jgi:hypothetical protein